MQIIALTPAPRSSQVTAGTRVPAGSPPPLVSIHHGVAILGAGSAIVSATRDDIDNVHVIGIERLTADIAPVVTRLRELEAADGAAHFHIGSQASGRALWDTLHVERRPRAWQLFDKRGIERQALVDGLLSAEAEERLTIDPELREAPAMRRALVGMTRDVKEDGVIGGELVVALALAVADRRPIMPQIF